MNIFATPYFLQMAGSGSGGSDFRLADKDGYILMDKDGYKLTAE